MNCFEKVYSRILNEALTMERSVYEPVMHHYLVNYRKFMMGGTQRVSPEKFPTVNVPLNVKGSKFEKFDYLKPNVNVDFSASDKASKYSPSTNTITLSFGEPIREVSDVVEHELIHYFQFLFDKYLKDKYADHPEKLRKEYVMFGKTDRVFGGLSSKKIAPENLDIHGYRKVFNFTVKGAPVMIRRKQKHADFPAYKPVEIEAESALKALKKLRMAVHKNKNTMTYGLYDKKPLVPDLFARGLVMAVHGNILGRRTLHNYRPIEYWTDLVSNLRQLQRKFFEELEKRGLTEEEITKAANSEQERKNFFARRYKNKALFHFGDDFHPNYKRSYLQKLYNMFVSQNVPYENRDFTKQVRQIQTDAENKVSVSKIPSEMTNFMEGLWSNFNIQPSNFDEKTYGIPSEDWIGFSNMDDNNTEYAENAFHEIGFKPSVSLRTGNEFIKMKRTATFLYRLFNNLKRFIGREKANNQEKFVGGDNKEHPYYHNGIYFAYSLLRSLQTNPHVGRYEPFKNFIEADSVKLLEYLLDMKLSPEVIDFIKD